MLKRGTLWMAALLALLLCMAACLPSALAEEAGPSKDGGWTQGDNYWFLNDHAHYDVPFISDESIQVNGVKLTAPSIDVTGDVTTHGGGNIECADLLQATGKVSVFGNITAGSLKCSGIIVTSGTLTVETSFELCGDAPVVTVNGTLYLPSDTTQAEVEALNATGDGRIVVGATTYDTKGNQIKGAGTIFLNAGSNLENGGLSWDGAECKLTLKNFSQYFSGEKEVSGIAIRAQGKAVTLVLKGDNQLDDLDEYFGIVCAANTLTLTGSGSLNCPDSGGALVVSGGTIALADGCQLEGGELCNNSPGDSYIAVSSENQTPATSFSLRMENSHSIQVECEEGGTATADLALAEPGDTVTLTATPENDYVFVRWEVTPDSVTINEDNTFTMPDSDVTIQAVFGKTSYAVTLHPNGGTIPEGSEITSYKYG